MERAGAASCAPSSADDGESVAHLPRSRPRRISVIGASGSGKSHLARGLAHELGIPFFELDHLRNDANGKRLSNEDFSAVVADLVKQDEWIIDGHYRIVRHSVWQRSTSIVWLDYPLSFVSTRLLERYLDKRRRAKSAKPDAADVQPVEFASWSSRIGRLMRAIRGRREYARLLGEAEQNGIHIIRVRDPKAADTLSAKLAKLDHDKIAPLGRWDLGPRRMIELLGAPGSGKSTIGNMVARELECAVRFEVVQEWLNKPMPIKAIYVVRGLLDLPCLFAAIRFAWTARITSRSGLDRLARVVAKRHWLQSRPGKVFLEQGYLQDVWSLLTFNDITHIERSSVARFLSVLYRGTNPVFLYVVVDPDTSTKRIVARNDGASRLDSWPENQIRQRLTEREWVTDLIYDAAIDAGLSITKICGKASVEDVQAEAMRVLSARGFGPPAPKS
jgi:adenylate kinase family enzyme